MSKTDREIVEITKIWHEINSSTDIYWYPHDAKHMLEEAFECIKELIPIAQRAVLLPQEPKTGDLPKCESCEYWKMTTANIRWCSNPVSFTYGANSVAHQHFYPPSFHSCSMHSAYEKETP